MYRTSDVVNVLPAGGYGGYGNGGFGGDGAWAGILALAALGGGFGGWGGRNGGCCNDFGGNGNAVANELATDTAALQDRISSEAIDEKVCRVEMAIGDAKYASALGDKDLQYAVMAGNNDLQRQISDCCCTTQRSIDQVRFDASLSNCQQNNYLAQEFCKVHRNIDDLRRDAEVAALKERIRIQEGIILEGSQLRQDQRILAGVQALLAANTPAAAA